jgi:integrase
MPINRVNFDAIERYMSKAVKNGMTAPTLKKVLVTLGGILKYATRKRYIEFNPIREIDKPKGQGLAKSKVDFLKPQEVRALLDKINSLKYRALVRLAVASGMRQGELLGLKWTDMDWFNGQVRVNRTFNHGRFYEPKSQTSRRSIDLGPSVISELRKWQLACPPNELALIFPNEAGRPMDCLKLVKRHFYPALRRAGLRRIRFHDLRHTYAALLIDQGEHPKYIQRQMGHSSIKVTMDTYGHLMEETNQEAPKRLDETLFGKNGDQMETTSGFQRVGQGACTP